LGPPPAEPNEDWVLLVERIEQAPSSAIDISGFRDGAHHWRQIRDDGRVIQAIADQAAYEPAEIDQIAENILLFQRDNGGWPKDYNMQAILTPDQAAAVRATRASTDTSFDNHNIHSQVDYLARAYTLRGESSWRNACLRGFDFLLAAQLAGGGFPQRYPDPQGYAAHITFNDGVMIGILDVLFDASRAAPHWRWLDPQRRERATQAVARGVECILRCQIVVEGVRTGWCQQHDATTLAAAGARTFELASICPQETNEIARFLMRLDHSDERIAPAVTAAVEWLTKTRLSGIRVQRVTAPVEQFQRHQADFDVVVVPDPAAPAIWARHYEIGTDRPIFAGRDGVKRYALAQIERERRTGTPWYGNWPGRLLDSEFPNWQKRETGPCP
jgi:PelA/Pel-15E family pectate lyase